VNTRRAALRIALIVASLVVLLAVPTALAGKGKPGGGTGGTTGSPALTGVVTGSSYRVTGTGFQPGEILSLMIGEANGCCIALTAVADGSGTFYYDGLIWAPGTYFVKANRLSGRRPVTVAEWRYQAP
jgi:hypothetical protein